MALGESRNFNSAKTLTNFRSILESSMIPWKPSIESCAKRRCARRDIDDRQHMGMNDVRGLLSVRDLRCINIHQTTGVRKIIPRRGSVRDRLKGRKVVHIVQGTPLMLRMKFPTNNFPITVQLVADLKADHTLQCVGDQRVEPIVHGMSKKSLTIIS